MRISNEMIAFTAKLAALQDATVAHESVAQTPIARKRVDYVGDTMGGTKPGG